MKKIISSIIFIICGVVLTIIIVLAFKKHEVSNIDTGNDITKYNLTNPSMVYYSDFDKVENYLADSKEYEILYIGRASCPYCLNYAPIINEIMYSKNKPFIYYSTENIKDTIESNGVVKNNPIHDKVVNWIIDNSKDAILNEYVKYKVVEGAENGKLLRLYTPRFFLIKDGKIIDCFMPKTASNVKGDTNEEKLIIKTAFNNFIDGKI